MNATANLLPDKGTTCTVVTDEGVCGLGAIKGVCRKHTIAGLSAFANIAGEPVVDKPIEVGGSVKVTHIGVVKTGTVTRMTDTFVWVSIHVASRDADKVIRVRRSEIVGAA